MVAKISSTANLGGALGYNFRKVEAGKALVLLVSGLTTDRNGGITMGRALEDMSLLLPLTIRTRKPVFHASLNPHPDDRLSDYELEKIAAFYMEQLGYGGQPYIVFRHSDIEREHIHIVSLRVDSDGNKINDSFERRRSKRITDEIERLWELNTGKRRSRTPAEEAVTPECDEGEVKRRVAKAVSTVLDRYRFQSLGELNAVLARYNVVAGEVGKESGGRRYRGLVYSVTDDAGKKTAVPIEAGELGRGFGYNALKGRMDAFRDEFAPYRAGLRKAVRMAMRGNPDRKEFVRLMDRSGVSVLFRENRDGRIYGITFIDDRNGIVANGSRLGKGYSASVFNGYFNGTGENPFRRTEGNSLSLPEKETRGDDLIAGMAEGLLDAHAAQGIDYRELAFQRKMRRLHSGKIRTRRRG